MRQISIGSALLLLAAIPLPAQQQPLQQAAREHYRAPNQRIDYNGFLANAIEVGRLREERRVSERDFLEMSREVDTVVFDARSDSKYALLHIRGARHLSLPDITEAELARVIPTKGTRVLIYCNNNFENEPGAFPSKAIEASLASSRSATLR